MRVRPYARQSCRSRRPSPLPRRVQLAPLPHLLHLPPAPVTRSGNGERFVAPCHPRGSGGPNRWAPRSIGRPDTIRRTPIRGRSAPSVAASSPVVRRIWRAGAEFRATLDLIRGRPGTGSLSIHTGRRSPRTHRADAGDRSSCQPFPLWKSRASPLVARLACALLHPISGGPGPFPQAFPAAHRGAPNQGPCHATRRHTGVQY